MRLTDDELERMYRTPDSITSRQVMLVVEELRERRAADDTATVQGTLDESVKPLKKQLGETKDLMLAVEMVLRDVASKQAVSDQMWPEAKRVLKLVRDFRSNLRK